MSHKIADDFVSLGKDVYFFEHSIIHEFVRIDDNVIVPPGCVILPFTHVKTTDVLTEWTVYQGAQIKRIRENKAVNKISLEEKSFLEGLYLEKLVQRRMKHEQL